MLIQTLFDSNQVDELIKTSWEDNERVTTLSWLNCLLRVAEGGRTGASDTEAFRLQITRNPIVIDMTNAMKTTMQVAKWTTDYEAFDATVSGNIGDEERKQQLLNLEKSMKWLHEGPQAKTEMANEFKELRNRKATFLEALKRLSDLHWSLQSESLNTKKWFNLASLIHQDDHTHPPIRPRAEDDKSDAKQRQQAPTANLTGLANTSPPPPGNTNLKDTHGIKPNLSLEGPLKWNKPSFVAHLCPVCNNAHLEKFPECSWLKKDPSLSNREGKPWKDSAIGKSYAKAGYYNALFHPPSWHAEQIAAGRTLPDYVSKQQGEVLNNINLYNEDENLTAIISVNITQAEGRNPAAGSVINCLIDTGAGTNFISTDTVKRCKLKKI